MRSSQWTVFGIFFILIGIFFMSIDMQISDCYTFEDERLSVGDIWCTLNSEMYDPFIWLLYPLAIVCFICAWIEERHEKK